LYSQFVIVSIHTALRILLYKLLAVMFLWATSNSAGGVNVV
jgi:hypothetical protein